MNHFIQEMLAIANAKQRKAALALLMMMVVGAALEVLGVGMIMPLLSLVSDPQSIREYALLNHLAAVLQLDDPKSMALLVCALFLIIYVIKNSYLALMYRNLYAFVFTNQANTAKRLLSVYAGQPYTFHLEHNSAELLRNINEEVRLLFNNILVATLTLAVEALVILVLGMTVLAIEPVIVPAAAVIFGGIAVLFYRAVRNKAKRYGEEKQQAAKSMIQSVNECLGAIKENIVLNRTDYFVDAYDQHSRHYANAMKYHATISVLPRFFIETAGIAAMVFILAAFLLRGDDPSDFLPLLGLFAMVAMRLMPSVTRIIAAITTIRHFRPALSVVHRDMTRLRLPQHTTQNHTSTTAPSTFSDTIEALGIFFSYPDTDATVLNDLNLRIKQGESVAFVGESGAGKTTLVDVILGLLKPQQGSISVDGNDIRDGLTQWQKRIGYIAQPTFLLDASVRRNVALGVEDDVIDDMRVWQVLTLAKLDAFVKDLPTGLDTELGESGVRFSGGQRQRIGVARALYHDPDLIVLDEATSALDNHTEREITQSIQALAPKKTIITIAHRLSTVRRCDRIFLLQHGTVATSGTFDELLSQHPDFQRLVKASEQQA